MEKQPVILYGLTTCVYCNALKKMLADLNIEHRVIQADLLGDEERQAMIAELKKINPSCSFPTVVVGDKVITGYKAQEVKEALGIKTEVDELYERLKKINEPKGYLFNGEKEKTFELLRSLLTNKDRYGYMACPCRLASGDREKDRDIMCPCDYREPDVKEFGSCYCGLYVSEGWYTGKVERVPIPERRSADLY
jgi:ferredoxin-thioredoxin reductase catalytic subunit